ncbi:MAG: hypothetical protein M3325_16975, partial [Actinomycetota bacterium]|nr:hypothetical protein [Actinomycetota bacterium]
GTDGLGWQITNPGRIGRALERASGIEPAWPAWKTALDARSGASTAGGQDHRALLLTVVYRG